MLPSSSSLQPLLSQFQTRYPIGSLTSELLTIHDGNYVVRALVTIGGTVLATGMATATDIEQAEDRAKARALEALGLSTAPPLPQIPIPEPQSYLSPTQPVTEMFSPTRDLPPEPPTVQPPLSPVSSGLPLSPTWVDPAKPSDAPSPAADSVIADWYSHINTEDTEPVSAASEASFEDFSENFSEDFAEAKIPLSNLHDTSLEDDTVNPEIAAPRPRNGKTARPKAAQPEPIPSDSVAVDLSDVIAQTDVELARLGWNKTQGREHLKRTYGKRSRQELDETELYDFLHYLESQP